MGGHGMARGTKPYSDIAHIAHGLAKSGCLVASGGGPGAMEATHLGAAFVQRQRSELDQAIAILAKSANLPDHLTDLIDEHGNVDPVLARGVHAYSTLVACRSSSRNTAAAASPTSRSFDTLRSG
jgi:hypothetical protein